ncbi:hypothetical protein rosag_45950 [Roseisolibacter agri]|uniref:Uncharacterized protein n=2 Tax=Roseisolibacter agri TaxID=2014610 RepID=A0AA37QD18_9BACT|nr:hypothetical protein rosag_45950 [Roseisolibacter agri]
MPAGGLPLAVNPRFAAHLRLLRALNAMERARAVSRESRELVARTRVPWAAPSGPASADADADDAAVLRLL